VEIVVEVNSKDAEVEVRDVEGGEHDEDFSCRWVFECREG
jgi:hypothetical protein